MRALCVLLAVAAVLFVSVSAQCSTDCTGGTGDSCYYCGATCGNCNTVGVITHCTQTGTAHLSYDDGPNQFSDGMLDILAANNIKASFWLIGSFLQYAPDFAAKAYAAGHLIGVHTWTHTSLNTESVATIQSEMTQTIAGIQALVPQWKPKYMRPPFGDLNNQARTTVQAMGLQPVIWNMDNRDYYQNQTWQRNNVTAYLSSYSPASHSIIVLSHPNYAIPYANVQWQIDALHQAGYKIVSAEECFDTSAPQPAPPANAPAVCVGPPKEDVFGQQCDSTHSCGQQLDGSHLCCGGGGWCGSGETYCGSTCINGACDVCVAAGMIPFQAPFPPLSASAGTTASMSNGAGAWTPAGSNSTTTTPANGATGSSSTTPGAPGASGSTVSSGSSTGAGVSSPIVSGSSTGGASGSTSSTPASRVTSGVSSASSPMYMLVVIAILLVTSTALFFRNRV